VISVGNLAVGGTGKTPVSAWVAGTLHAAGARTCVLVGAAGADEAELHRTWNRDVPVLTGRDRVANAASAQADGAEVAVLDDGFQHRALARDLDLVLMSADDPDPGRLLPRGPYREPRAALARADAVVVTRRSAGPGRARELAATLGSELERPVAASLHLAPGAWRWLDGTPTATPVGDVLAVGGVARPMAFRQALDGIVGGAVELVSFADHHRYTAAEVERVLGRAEGRPLVVTEKDAMKFARLLGHEGAGRRVLVLADRLTWDWGEDGLRTRVLAAVRAGLPA